MHRLDNAIDCGANARPTRRREHQYRDAPRRQVLLVLQVLIGRNEQGEIGVFGGLQQFSILQLCPSALERRIDGVASQELTERDRRALIEQNAQLRRRDSTARSMREDGPHLFERNARKPLEELMQRHVVFEILEQGRDGDTRATEQPRTAVPLVVLFDRIAGGPVDHTLKYSESGLGRLTPCSAAGLYNSAAGERSEPAAFLDSAPTAAAIVRRHLRNRREQSSAALSKPAAILASCTLESSDDPLRNHHCLLCERPHSFDG